MTTKFNIRTEVEALLGRKMTAAEARIFADCRQVGFANPYDIKRELEKAAR